MESAQRSRLVVLAAVGGAFLTGLDLFVVNVAFDAIGEDFGVGTPGGPSPADLSWIISGYAVVFAALLVPFGRFADRYGRRRVFIGGTVVFLAASTACALAWSVPSLVGFRGLQAVGAAAMTPTSLAILLGALPAERRAGGVRMWAATSAIAAALGPTVGGLLTQVAWQLVFLINLPVGVAMLVVAIRYVPEAASDRSGPAPDFVGATLVALAVGLLALGLVNTPEWGWWSAATIACFAVAVGLGAAFVLRCRRHPAPIVDPALLRHAGFRWGAVSMLVFSVSFALSLLAGILWLEQVWGWSPMTTGFAVAIGPALVPVTAAVVNRSYGHVRPAVLVTFGCLICGIGMVLLALTLSPDVSYVACFLPGWAITGVGVGLALPNLLAAATVDLPPADRATGSGVISMSRQVGFVIGVSVLFAVVGDRVGAQLPSAYLEAWWVAAALCVVAAVASLPMRARPALTARLA